MSNCCISSQKLADALSKCSIPSLNSQAPFLSLRKCFHVKMGSEALKTKKYVSEGKKLFATLHFAPTGSPSSTKCLFKIRGHNLRLLRSFINFLFFVDFEDLEDWWERKHTKSGLAKVWLVGL